MKTTKRLKFNSVINCTIYLDETQYEILSSIIDFKMKNQIKILII